MGVLKTTDGGTFLEPTGLTWTINQSRTISKVLMHPANSGLLMAASQTGCTAPPMPALPGPGNPVGHRPERHRVQARRPEHRLRYQQPLLRSYRWRPQLYAGLYRALPPVTTASTWPSPPDDPSYVYIICRKPVRQRLSTACSALLTAALLSQAALPRLICWAGAPTAPIRAGRAGMI